MTGKVYGYNPELFGYFVIKDNELRRNQLSNDFMPALRMLDVLPQTNLCLVGSDGKQERYPQSKTEIVIAKRPEQPSLKSALTSFLNLADRHLETAYDGCFGEYTIPEYSETQPEIPLSFQFGDPKKIYPDFLLNSMPLGADPLAENFETYTQMRMHVLREMGDGDKLGKKIREALRKQLSSYRQGISDGVYGGQVGFDSDSIYYDEGDLLNPQDAPRRKNFGVKVPFIRSVQRKLDMLTAEFAHINNNDGELIRDLAEQSPTNTPNRILFLNEIGLISSDISGDLKNAYLYFLQRQHECQAKYKQERQPVSVQYNQLAFREYAKVIKEFVAPREI